MPFYHSKRLYDIILCDDWQLVEPIQIGVAILVPALVLGLVGGLLGATFTRLNAAIIVRRKRLHARIANIHLQRLAKIGEPIVLVVR